MEVIPLQHRFSAEVIPVLQPLVSPGGTVTGMNDRLIVRTTPSNLIELKRVLASIDQAARRLRISVRQNVSARGTANEQGLSGSYRSGGVALDAPEPVTSRSGVTLSQQGRDGELRYRINRTTSETDDGNVYFVQTVEGQAALIQTGQSVPLPERSVYYTEEGVAVRDSIQYRDVTSGFYVVPRLNGDQVTLAISPQRSRLDGSGAISVQTAETTASGRLGAWIDLGGVTERFADRSDANLTRARRQGSEVRGIWVKVDEVR